MRRLILYVLLLALLGGCAAPVDPDTARESIQVLAMDTAMLITTYGERSVPAAYACEDTIRRPNSPGRTRTAPSPGLTMQGGSLWRWKKISVV